MKLLTSLLDLPYQIFKDLEDVDVYHVRKPADKETPYAVWIESGDASFNSDNQRSERVLEGTLDFYTLEDLDPALDLLEEAMCKMGASWQLVAVQDEPETNLIHYTWEWTVM